MGPEEEGPRTRQQVAEQLLQWLLGEAVAAAEPQLMLQAAEKTAAWGGLHAEAARRRWKQQPGDLELQLQRTPLPSHLDHRVLHMAEYLSKVQAPAVKDCTRAVVLFDGKTTDELLYLLQRRPTAGKRIWIQQLLQNRLGYLRDLLPQAREGVLLCLEVSPQQQQKLELQHQLLLQRLVQELVEEYLLPAVFGDDPQQYQVPVACLETTEDFASFVEAVAAKKGIGLVSDHLVVSGERAGQDDDTDEDVEEVPSLLIIPSWQQFFSAAAEKLDELQGELVVETSEIALVDTQSEHNEDKAPLTESGKSNYLSAQRQLSKLSELLDIDFVILDSPCHVLRTAEASAAAVGEDALKDPHMVASAAAASTASSPWLLEGPAARALGPYVVAYLQAACLLLGIDSVALHKRAAEAVVDWREEQHKRQSLDAAAASAKRQMQRHLEPLCTNSRSCCCSNIGVTPREPTKYNESPLLADSMDGAGQLSAPVLDAADQQATHTATAVLCAYWDQVVPTGQGTPAPEEAAAEDPLLKWASFQLQKLRMLVSGTIVSNILLAGDLISLICGLALNGDVALETDVQETPGQEDVLSNPHQEADTAAAAAAAAAAARAGDAASAEPGLPRCWLRLCRTAPVEGVKPSIVGAIRKSCSIHPRVYNLRQIRSFVQAQLRTILEIAKDREVVIQLPTEVLLQVDVQPAALATAAASATAEAAPRGRRTSDGVGGTQRNSTKKPRGSAKGESLEGHIEDAGAGDAAGAPPAEEEKQTPVLAVCHLPPADILWKVIFAESSDSGVPPEEENTNNATTRRRSEEGMEASRACGAYAGMTQQAVENAVASFGGPPHVLWIGEKLSRETEGMENLLDAAGIPDATAVMVESLVKANNMLENSFSNPDDDFGYRAPSTDSVLLGSSASFDASSSQSSMMSNCEEKRISLDNTQRKLGTEHILLFGSIARNSWAFAQKGIAKVEAFLDMEPLLQMLQGRRVKDLLLADDMFLGQEKEKHCTEAQETLQTVCNLQLKPRGLP